MDVSDNILSVIENTHYAIIKGTAERVKERRLGSAFTQKELAKRAGIPLPTYRRFERTGENIAAWADNAGNGIGNNRRV